MGFVYMLTLAIQVGFVVHVLNTGRDRYWIYLIMFIPVVGWMAYLFTQVLPDARHDPRARRAGRKLKQTLDPMGEVRRLRDQLALADNLDNRLALANACVEARLWEEAEQLYQNCLTGPYRDDPHMLLKLATAEFEQGKANEARDHLETLIASNPEFQSHDGHLLYAKALAETGDSDRALEEYATLADAFPGEEARIRYALLLKEQGKVDQAVEQFNHTLLRVKRAPKYYQQKEKRWIKVAQENLRT